MSEAMMWLMGRGIWETVIMTLTSGLFGFVLGLPFGVLLYVTRPGQIAENKKVYRVMSAVVNIFRSIHYFVGLDDSVYPINRRHLDRFASGDRAINRRCGSVYCTYG